MSTTMGVIALNNKAADFVKQGLYGDAHALFKEAFCGLKDILSSVPLQELQESGGGNLKFEASNMPSRRGANTTVTITLLPPSGTLVKGHERPHNVAPDAAGIYDIALYLTGPDDQALGSCEGRERVLGAILYNIGLIYHLHGVRNSAGDKQKREHSYSKSLQFYKLASQSLPPTVHGEGWTISDILLNMVIVNNKGHIHLARSHSYEAKMCGLVVNSTIRYFIPPNEIDEESFLEIYSALSPLVDFKSVLYFQTSATWLIEQSTIAPAA